MEESFEKLYWVGLACGDVLRAICRFISPRPQGRLCSLEIAGSRAPTLIIIIIIIIPTRG